MEHVVKVIEDRNGKGGGGEWGGGWRGIFSGSSVSVGQTGPSQILAYGSICDPSPNRLWSAFDLKS